MQKGDPIEVNFEGLEMQKWNIPTDRVQRVDEKNVIICLVIMFTYGVMVIKMSKMAHFLYFLLMIAKNSHSFGKTFKCIWKILILISSFRKFYFRILSYH